MQTNMVPAILATLLVGTSDISAQTSIQKIRQLEDEEKRFPEDRWPNDQVPSMVDYKPSSECPNCPKDFRIGDCW